MFHPWNTPPGRVRERYQPRRRAGLLTVPFAHRKRPEPGAGQAGAPEVSELCPFRDRVCRAGHCRVCDPTYQGGLSTAEKLARLEDAMCSTGETWDDSDRMLFAEAAEPLRCQGEGKRATGDDISLPWDGA